jgi:ketosteroid isomerase-like protein
MSQENVEIVRGAYEAFNRGGPEALIGTYWPDDFVLDMTRGGFVEGPEVYFGADEARAFFDERFTVFPFADWYAEVERLLDCGNQVVAFVRQRGRGSATTPPTEMEMTQICSLRDGKIIRLTMYADRDEALAAVGPSA